ncbi:MAG: FAD-dependent oxidoreductase [Candidatus Berkiella sp.]
MLYDVVILGGGVVGASLALMLAQCHYQVVVVEKKAAATAIVSDMQARTVALSYASVHILKSLGVWAHLEQNKVPIQEVLVSVAGRLGRSHLKASEQDAPYLGQVVAFDELERVLFAALAKMPNAKIYHNATLSDYIKQEQAWQLTISTENPFKIQTKLLVAADGIDSSVRKHLGIEVRKTEYGHFAILANLQRKAAPAHTAIERFLKDGAFALLPWRNQLATSVFTVTEDQKQHLHDLDDQEYLMACQQALGLRYGQLVGLGKRIYVPLTMQVATQQTSHRFLLMGNAAHSLHPIAAQGLNLSLRDIWQLKKQLCTSHDKIDLGNTAFLDVYLKSRQADQSRIIFATDNIAKYLSGGPLPMGLRALGVTLFDCIAPAKKLFTRYSMGLM